MKAPNRVKINIGDIFGKLVVLDELPLNDKWQRYFLCECSCIDKTQVTVILSKLRNGHTKSCGCLRKETASKNFKKHGLSSSPLIGVRNMIKERCYNKNNEAYENYGNRGITVCDEWLNDFNVFYNWCIDNGWKEGLCIDRRNNDGNYEPNNCHFVKYQENNENKRLIQKNNTSGYRGVFRRKSGLYRAIVNHKNKIVYNKSGFKTARQAAILRDIFCIKNHIPFALNFPELATNGLL